MMRTFYTFANSAISRRKALGNYEFDDRQIVNNRCIFRKIWPIMKTQLIVQK